MKITRPFEIAFAAFLIGVVIAFLFMFGVPYVLLGNIEAFFRGGEIDIFA